MSDFTNDDNNSEGWPALGDELQRLIEEYWDEKNEENHNHENDNAQNREHDPLPEAPIGDETEAQVSSSEERDHGLTVDWTEFFRNDDFDEKLWDELYEFFGRPQPGDFDDLGPRVSEQDVGNTVPQIPVHNVGVSVPNVPGHDVGLAPHATEQKFGFLHSQVPKQNFVDSVPNVPRQSLGFSVLGEVEQGTGLFALHEAGQDFDFPGSRVIEQRFGRSASQKAGEGFGHLPAYELAHNIVPSGPRAHEQHFNQGSPAQKMDEYQDSSLDAPINTQHLNNTGISAIHEAPQYDNIPHPQPNAPFSATAGFTIPSDGDPTHEPTDDGAYEVKDVSRCTAKLNDYLEKNGGIPHRPIQWPSGFRVFKYARPTTNRFEDTYVYGHPQRRRWRSVQKFFVHVRWLIDGGMPGACQCVCCRPGAKWTN